jgi:catechol 2,3-dioxygenase-like lactoylglutathione lyase family enzyme
MLKRLDNVGIAVADARRALEFYTTKLGFEGEVTGGEGACRLGDIALFIFETPTEGLPRSTDYPANPRGIDHLSFEVDDIEAAGAALEARGIVFEGGIVGAPGEFRYRGFHDPDGTMLYIIQHPPR